MSVMRVVGVCRCRADYDIPMKDGSPDDCLRQIIVLAEELLNLLIIIIGTSHSSVIINSMEIVTGLCHPEVYNY